MVLKSYKTSEKYHWVDGGVGIPPTTIFMKKSRLKQITKHKYN